MVVHITFVNVQEQVLAAVFGTLRVDAVQLGRIELFAPWGGPVAPQADLLLHYVVEGQAWLLTEAGETYELNCGDVVLITRHCGHVLSDSRVPPTSDASFWQHGDIQTSGLCAIERRLGGEGARTVLLCAALDLGGAGKRLLQEALQQVVHLQAGDRDAIPGLTTVLDLIRSEVRHAGAAAELMLARYAEILVLGVLRAAPVSDRPSWLLASTDDGVARALEAIHNRPREAWSVGTLAKQAGMSRSAFAATFTRSVGEGPIRYLTRWRLALAKELVETGRSGSVEVVAEQVGYANAAAFGTAFRREFGFSPGALRRRSSA